ncbi:MAG: DNRLRE domain-containing protein, partial [Planctomycetes bacterium]|nr:DNRLRE domain-containing protein [Planctomycetota bacterium]
MKRTRGISIALLVSVLLPAYVFGGDVYVATNGNDSDKGRIDSPFRTIERAVSELDPGETCYIRGGTYHEEVSINDLDGDSGDPITFTNYNGEEVIIDGSESIADLGGTNWTVHQGNIYKTTINKDIWQLWVDDKMAIVARWPNVTVGHPCDPIALKDDGYTPVDGSWWDIGTWGKMASSWNAEGSLTNDAAYHDMAAENVSFAGGSIVLNFHSESQFSRPIAEHTAGTNTLLHVPVINPHDKGSGYFLIEHKNALDQPGEWYYDMNTGEVWLWCEDGQTPQGRDVRGKTISYALTMDGCSYIEIRGINFFGSTINSTNGLHITIEDCNFSYPTWFRRMLGEHTYNMDDDLIESRPEPMGEGGTFLLGDKNGTYYTMRNCVWEYSDGLVDMYNGYGNLVDNCLFHHWSFTGMASYVLNTKSDPLAEQRNVTYHTNGSKVMSKTYGKVRYCHAYYFGYFQQDGVAWQCPGFASSGVVRDYNWHHDAMKAAVRWDGNEGINGTDHHLVSWNAPASMMIKGDYHDVISNTCLLAHDYTENLIKILTEDADGGETQAANDETYNNLTDSMSSVRDGYVPLAGTSHSNNWNGYLHDRMTGDTADKQVRDAENWDFRPAVGSDLIDAGIEFEPITNGYLGQAPDIGAYEYGDTNYWIPGYKDVIASTPVPPHDATTAKPDCDLMWLAGRDASSHNVYFGTDSGNLTLQGNQTNNIFDPAAGDLTAGQTYYWRIDTVTSSGTITGDEWSFTVQEPVQTGYANFFPTDDSYVESTGPYSNFGSNDQIKLRTSITDGFDRHGYMKFNVDVPGPVISANLNLHSDGSANIVVEVYGVTDNNWTENTLTWYTRPEIDGPLQDSKTVVGGGRRDFDVSGHITGSGYTSLGFKRPASETVRRVSSKDFYYPYNVPPIDYRPILTIEYQTNAAPVDEPPAAPTNLTAVGGVGQISLNWDDHTAPDVVGYRLYRRQNPDDNFTQIHPRLLTVSDYVDTSMLPDLPYQYVVKAEDAIEQLSLNSNIATATATAAPINNPPTFDTDPTNEIDATEGVAYSTTIADDADDPESDPMTFSKTGGPAWLNVAANGDLSGTPTNADVGSNVFTIQVSATGGTDTATLNISVYGSPDINGDGDFNIEDFTPIAKNWQNACQAPTWCDGADLNINGTIEIT